MIEYYWPFFAVVGAGAAWFAGVAVAVWVAIDRCHGMAK